jgi:hypothetical protein
VAAPVPQSGYYAAPSAIIVTTTQVVSKLSPRQSAILNDTLGYVEHIERFQSSSYLHMQSQINHIHTTVA